MTNRELWEQIMEQTEKEIRTNCYRISFGLFDKMNFPRPAVQKQTFTSKLVRLLQLISRYRKIKMYPKGIQNFFGKRRILSAAKDLVEISIGHNSSS